MQDSRLTVCVSGEGVLLHTSSIFRWVLEKLYISGKSSPRPLRAVLEGVTTMQGMVAREQQDEAGASE